MRSSLFWVLLTLAVVGAVVTAGCQTRSTPAGAPPSPTPQPVATAVPDHAAAPVESTATTAPSSAMAVSPTSTSAARVRPTATPMLPVWVEDCMDACHIPDANETFDAGAKPQPKSHQGYTTCLECHAKLAQPALPSTHVGRMDAACAGCHKPETQSK